MICRSVFEPPHVFVASRRSQYKSEINMKLKLGPGHMVRISHKTSFFPIGHSKSHLDFLNTASLFGPGKKSCV